MDIVENLTADYQRFPANQTYSLYAQDVFFHDPLNKFRGIKKYKAMIGFINIFLLIQKWICRQLIEWETQLKWSGC